MEQTVRHQASIISGGIPILLPIRAIAVCKRYYAIVRRSLVSDYAAPSLHPSSHAECTPLLYDPGIGSRILNRAQEAWSYHSTALSYYVGGAPTREGLLAPTICGSSLLPMNAGHCRSVYIHNSKDESELPRSAAADDDVLLARGDDYIRDRSVPQRSTEAAPWGVPPPARGPDVEPLQECMCSIRQIAGFSAGQAPSRQCFQHHITLLHELHAPMRSLLLARFGGLDSGADCAAPVAA